MDHHHPPALTQQPPAHALKPARRRLQKSDPKLKVLNKLKRASADSTTSRKNSNNDSHSPPLRQIHSSGGAPDLSDEKWSHYLRPMTVVGHEDQAERRNIPEFEHLSVPKRPELEREELPSPASSTSTSSTMRRQAKTPVFSIGQLERKQQQQSSLEREADKTSSVELIAEQYRALLESRSSHDSDSIYEGSGSHLAEPWQDILNVPMHSMLRDRDGPPRSRGSSRHRPAPLQHLSPRLQPTTTTTTTRQDGSDTMGFEEDVIYFKPISFSTEATSSPPTPPPRFPQHQHHHHHAWNTPPSSRPSSQSTDNISLQICLDLLTRELSSAVAEPLSSSSSSSGRRGPETAALQVYVMIEAYERLRDQVRRMAGANPQFAVVGEMFDTWLRALYAIHENIVVGAVPDESEWAGLQEGLD